MKPMTLSIDFKEVCTEDDFHNKLDNLFGFFDGYGRNFNAFIDCLKSLRIPEDGMTSINLKQDEYVLLKVLNINSLSDNLIYNFLLSVKNINVNCTRPGEEPLIQLKMEIMKPVTLSIDFQGISAEDDFHNKLDNLFGFFDGYGRNFNALMDCFNSLRYPEDGMTSVNLKHDEYILLKVLNINSLPDNLICNFLLSIDTVNQNCKMSGEEPLILLLLTGP